jgi:hypothetical protein
VQVSLTARVGLLGDHQTQVCSQVGAARGRQLAAETVPSARRAPASFVWPVLVEQGPQCGDDLGEFDPGQVHRGGVVAALCSTGQVAKTLVQ